MEKKSTLAGFYAVIALAIGLVGGYFYGLSEGVEKGRNTLIAEQQAAQEAERVAAQEEIAQKANPFVEASQENVLDSGYENPFEASVNPFRQ